MQKLDLAFKELNYALELKPDFAKAYFSRGECFQEQQNYAAALKEWATALGFANREEQLEVLSARCQLYSKLGKYKYIDEKYPDFVHNVSISDTTFDEHELHWQEIYQLALTDINKILLAEPNPHFYYRRSEIYLHLEDYQKALENCNAAIGIWEDNPLYYSLRSQIYKALGNKEAAAGDTQKSRELIEQHKGLSKAAEALGLVKEDDN
jgi:tetratricopeptide (TPR) repeat protein